MFHTEFSLFSTCDTCLEKMPHVPNFVSVGHMLIFRQNSCDTITSETSVCTFWMHNTKNTAVTLLHLDISGSDVSLPLTFLECK